MAAKPLPKWLFVRYSKLWHQKKGEEFDFNEAQILLKEKDARVLSVVLSDLRKYGWLVSSLAFQDSRKRKYCLTSPQDAVEQIGLENSKME